MFLCMNVYGFHVCIMLIQSMQINFITATTSDQAMKNTRSLVWNIVHKYRWSPHIKYTHQYISYNEQYVLFLYQLKMFARLGSKKW